MLSHRCDSVLRETTGGLAGPADLSWRKRRQSEKSGSAEGLQYPLAKRALTYCDTLPLQVMMRANTSASSSRDGRAEMRTFLATRETTSLYLELRPLPPWRLGI